MISINCSILERLGGIKSPLDDPNLKGISRYFNSSTVRGRANTAKATYGVILAGLLYWYGKSKGGKKEEVKV